MSNISLILFIFSSLGLAVISLINYFSDHKSIKRLLFNIFLIAGYIYLLNSMFNFGFVKFRSSNNEIYVIAALYFFMIIGMLSQYAHSIFERPKRYRKKFDFGCFVAPVLASPIIFLPLLEVLLQSNHNFNNDPKSKIMIFIVAFENGFFWRYYFDKRNGVKKETA